MNACMFAYLRINIFKTNIVLMCVILMSVRLIFNSFLFVFYFLDYAN